METRYGYVTFEVEITVPDGADISETPVEAWAEAITIRNDYIDVGDGITVISMGCRDAWVYPEEEGET